MILLAACAGFCNAQIGIINTFAGSSNGIVPGDGSPANRVLVSNPAGLAIDVSGNVYIAASGNSLIRKVDPGTGIITTVAGGGTGGDGGLAINAQLTNPCDVKLDGAGNLYLAETCVIAEGGGGGGGGGPISRVRQVDATTGIITTVAGATTAGFSGDGGPATQALLNMPIGLALDSAGNLYVADAGNNRVRRVDAGSGIITTVAGNGSALFAGDGGPATLASLNLPTGVTFDANGNLYIADLGNNRIRRVEAATGTITTIAGTASTIFDGDGVAATSAGLSGPASLAFNSSGNLIFSEVGDGRVRLIDSAGLIWTLAGPGGALEWLGDNGPASGAFLSRPEGVAVSTAGTIYISELTGGRVRSIVPPYLVATAVTVSAAGNTFPQSSPVAMTATLTAANGQPNDATGWVTIYDGTTAIYGGALANGVMSFSTSSLALGPHNIQAIYAGDGSFAGSYSPAFGLTIFAPPSNVSLSASPNPGVANQPVSLTATVSPSAATGSVTFFNGTTGLGSAAVNSGVAILNNATFAAGNYSLTARYNGDINYATVLSSPVALVVKAASSATVASSLNPSNPNQAVTFTATVTPAAATGSVQFLDGPTVLTTMPLTSGSAVFTTSTLAQGIHSISVLYTGDSNNSSVQSAAITQTVNAATSTSLVSSQNPSSVGAQVTLSATVAPATATGTVQFLDGKTVLANVTLVGAAAQFNTTELTQGAHSITAVYSGDANDSTSTSSALTQTVKQVPTVSLASSLNPSVVGQSVAFTVTVNAAATGTVQFLDGATVLATVPVTSGSAVYSSTALTQGTHPISAAYSGDSIYASSQSAVLTQTVNPKASTTTTLLSPTNPSPVGSPVSLTAYVVPSTATGSVQFLDGATVLGTVTLSNGSAVFTATDLTQGTHLLTAVYLGDAVDAGSTSAVVSEAIKLNVGFFAINTSLNPSAVGQTVTFTIGINPAATGTVQIQDGSTIIAMVPINAGSAAYSTSTLSLGAHTITAIYNGDGNYVPTQSSYFIQAVNAKATTTTAIASNQNPASLNAPVTLTATISPSSASGTVQFLDGGTLLGTANIASGSAYLTTSALTQGVHSITAVYSGDATNSTSTSSVLTQTVRQVPTVSLASSLNPSVVGQSVAFTVTLNATATGTVQVLDGATVIATVPVTSGSAIFSSTTITQGNHQISASYSGDSNFASAQSAVLTQTVKASTTTTLVSPTNPSPVGAPVILTAMVAPASATGTVQFLDGATVLGTATLSGGSAVFTATGLTQGTHPLTAVYLGDAADAGSTSAVVSEAIKLNLGLLAINTSLNPSVVGQTVTFTISINPAATGTVQIQDGSTIIATLPVNAGSAAYSTSTLALGAHTITAIYNGDANYVPSQSSYFIQTINAKATTTTAIASSQNPAFVNAPVTFTAAVSPSSATGTMQFRDGPTVLGTANIAGGTALLTIATLAQGAHSITAAYSGDASNLASTSPVLSQTINPKTAAAVSLSSSPNPSLVGATVAVTAVVTPANATGTVQFLDGGTVIGTASVASGTASLNTSSLARGVHSLTAVYSGDATDTAATSGVLTQTVKTSASISLTSTPNPSNTGQSVSLTATVSPSTATGTVQFLDGATVLSTVTLSSGSAIYATTQLAAGAHSLSAVYSGDTSDTAATSAVITQTVHLVAPAAPSSLTASAAGSSQINLSWTASSTSGVTYDVYESTSNGFTPNASNRLATGIVATAYSATGLTASKAYYFRVTAVNSAGDPLPRIRLQRPLRHP